MLGAFSWHSCFLFLWGVMEVGFFQFMVHVVGVAGSGNASDLLWATSVTTSAVLIGRGGVGLLLDI